MELNDKQKQFIDNKLNLLSKSKFRSSHHLRKYMYKYINEKGIDKIEKDAYEIIKTRIGEANPKNDGKQTPLKNHPVFIAQHACACCCRSCLSKWHKIPKGRELTDKEIRFIVALIMEWIKKEYGEENK